MTAAQCKALLKSAGLRVSLEKDATSGYEFAVYDHDGDAPVVLGWSAGTMTDALNEAVSDCRSKGRIPATTGATP